MGVESLGRVDVDVGPELVVGADGNDGEVEGPHPGADLGEAARGARVAGEVGRVLRASHRPPRPQGLGLGETATGVVPSRGARQPDAAHLELVEPVEGRDALARHPPGAQVCVDPERHDVARAVGGFEKGDRGLVEVVVVVVRDQYGVDRREVLDLSRHGMEPPRTGEADGRGPVTEDGVKQEPNAVDLENRGRVAVPGHSELSRHRRRLGGHDRHLTGRSAASALTPRGGGDVHGLRPVGSMGRLGGVEPSLVEVR